jgi:hypothetical protein
MKVLDAVKRRKGQPDLSRGTGFLPGAPRNIINSQLCMSGCSKQAWLNKGKVPRNSAHKRVLKKDSTQLKIFI